MNIRKMVDGDQQVVLDMMIPFYNSDAVLCHPDETVLKKCISDCVAGIPYVEGFVFEMDGVIAGYGMTAIGYATEAGGICVHIEDIYIKPQFRGRGIGTAFLTFIGKAYPNALHRLEVEAENEKALRVYKNCGFTELPYMEMKR